MLFAICTALVFYGPALAGELTADDGKRALKPKARQLALDKKDFEAPGR